MATVIAVVAALGAACCFACAAVVQHRAARDVGGTALSPALLPRLARNPQVARGQRAPSGVAINLPTAGYWIFRSAGGVDGFNAPWSGFLGGELPSGTTVTAIVSE